MSESTSYLARYLAGDREAVWDELLWLGGKVRVQPLLDDAVAVARETVRRASHNIDLLHQRLVMLGYQFADPNAAFALAGPNASEQIAEMERRLGTFPLLAKAWYQSIASVNFVQDKSQLRGQAREGVIGLGSHSALIMQSLERCWEGWLRMCALHEEHCRESAPIATTDPEFHRKITEPLKPFLPTGGSASNCDPKGFELPCLGADGVLYNDGGGDMHLIRHLRWCLQWGGFPFCSYYADGNKPFPWDTLPDWERLVPLLCEGLLEV